MGSSTGDDRYSVPKLASILHSLPHVNITLHRVNNTFEPRSPVYQESIGILGSIPAAWLILTLFVLLIYFLSRCCDRKSRTARSISALKVTLAIVSVLCCSAIGLGLYGNDDLHNGLSQLLAEGRQVDELVSKIRNTTSAIENKFVENEKSQLTKMGDAFDDYATNQTALAHVIEWLHMARSNNSAIKQAAIDIRTPMHHINLSSKLDLGEKFEAIRWPFTMAVLSVLLVLCVILLVGVARHNRCALIAFSVCGLLAIIVSCLMASIYLATSVALSDLCVAPDKFLEEEVSSPVLYKEIIHYYTNCERARANPFTQRLREAKSSIVNLRNMLTQLRTPAIELFPKKGLDTIFPSLQNQVKDGEMLLNSLTTLVDCRDLHSHYLRGSRALCNVGLLGLCLMLLSSILSAILLTILVWVGSHTWIYIRKRKDYHQVNETDNSYLPAPAASQAIAARTLQRSQGSYPPDTPPPSYTSAMLHISPHATAPPHEAQLLIDGCDKRSTEPRGAHLSHLRGHTLGRLPSHHHHESFAGPNNGKYATLSKQCKTLESSDFY